ncbi:PDDEXK nuclease domain-containing protein [Marinospirillum insulare]|uniref:YhcG N-terminal domain-containing protein n=1 Tax=Marinospirillum insulare TaxID=217169 RepID=A0ABQ5ZXX8_9GAMM|nr:PDDEXK nuclease domain-containing protein [Marinospirillum insulare]GLR63870.1 hypothetical protein GCM10007878_13070 [Marinospirillum insulare]
MNQPSEQSLASLVEPIAKLIEHARGQVRQAVNSALVHSYWHIGEMLVEHEQQGASRAEYGTQQLKLLSTQLTERLGKGFDVTNLRNMRRFYHAFPIWETVSLELSWTHYRSLLRIDNPTIGLVLCSEKSEAVVKYSVLSEQKQLFSAKYLPYLPTEEQLKHELERERANAMAQLAAKEQNND